MSDSASNCKLDYSLERHSSECSSKMLSVFGFGLNFNEDAEVGTEYSIENTLMDFFNMAKC